MRRVILQEFITLNGLAAGPKNNVDFVPASTEGDPSMDREQSLLIESVDLILLGRVTYQMFAGFWPNVTEGPEKEFAVKLNETPKVVFSKTLERAPWGKFPDATIVKSDAAAEVAKLRKQSGKDMVLWGSISLAQSLIKAQLVDEYRLVICPLVLEGGRPLFGNQPLGLKLAQSVAHDHGAVELRYVPRPEP